MLSCEFCEIFRDSFFIGKSEKWDPRPGTVGGTRDPRSGTHLIGGTRGPKGGTNPRPGTLEVDFQKIFPVFSESWRL